MCVARARKKAKRKPKLARSTSERNFDAELRATPDDAEVALVYADYLIGRGDPRGELIVLQHRIDEFDDGAAREELEAAETAYLRRHSDALLGPLVEANAAVSWRRGFAQRIELGDVPAPLIAAVLAHPSARYVTELALDPITSATAAAVLALPIVDQLTKLEILLDDWLAAREVVAALAARPRALKSLGFGTTDVVGRSNAGTLYEAWDLQPLVDEATVSTLAPATPSLTALELRGIYMLAGLVHPALRRMTLVGDPINGCPWNYLDGRVALPRLEHLDVRLVKDEYRLASIFPLALTPSNAPALRDLAFSGAYDSGNSQTTLLAVLAASPLLPQLARLSISDLQLDDLPTLRELAPRFAHLERFHVDALDDEVDGTECRRWLSKVDIG